jgi:hypothetical protein
MIIRARQKPLDQLPPWALCCDRTRASHEARANEVVEVESGKPFVASSTCAFCGTVARDVKYLVTARERNFGCVAIELFDFDEGVVDG